MVEKKSRKLDYFESDSLAKSAAFGLSPKAFPFKNVSFTNLREGGNLSWLLACGELFLLVRGFEPVEFCAAPQLLSTTSR